MSLVAVIVAAMALVASAAAPASAAPKLVDSVVGTTGSGATGGLFNSPQDIAVNTTANGGVAAGTVYVVEASNHRVSRFGPDGSFQRAWGVDVVSAGPGDTGSGAAARFEICVAPADTCKAGAGTAGNVGDNFRNGAFSSPQGIAVDPGTGNVYVTDRSNFRVNQYTADGVFVRSWGQDVAATVNEVQTVTVNATAGDFRLTFNGQATGDIDAATATAATVQGALNGLSSVTPGSVTVSGGPANAGGTTPFVVTFASGAGIAATNVPPIAFTAGTAALSGGSGAGADTVSFATTAQGGGAATGFEVCQAADRCKVGATTGSAAGTFGGGSNSWRIAITPTGGSASKRSVFVADPGNSTVFRRVQRFDLDGTLDTTQPVIGSATQFTTDRPLHVAVDAAGILYAANHAPQILDIQRYDTNTNAFLSPITDGALLGQAGGSTGIQGLEADPLSGNLLLVNNPTEGAGDNPAGDTLIREIAAPGSVAPTLVERHMVGSGNRSINGLGIDHAGARDKLFVTTGNQLFVLDADGASPSAVAAPTGAFGVGAHAATLAGTVDPVGVTAFPTSYYFEYSKTGVEGSWVKVTAGAGPFTGGVVNVADTVTGLEANTLYRFRLVTERTSPAGFAGRTVSTELVFATDTVAPEVETLRQTQRTATGATLLARINPNNTSTTYRFEYVTAAQFAQSGWAGAASSPAPPASAGSAGQPALYSHAVTGLQPDTAYRYRVIATNGQPADPVASPSDLDVEGAERQFTTRSASAGAGSRVYEKVTPADKPVGNGPGHHSSHDLLDGEMGIYGAVPSTNGGRVLMAAGYGATLAPGAASFAVDHALSERGGTAGWVTRSAFNRVNHSPFQSAPFLTTVAANPSLSLMAWMPSLSGAQLFPEMPAAGFDTPAPLGTHRQFAYLRDWEGRWELVAPRAGDQDSCCLYAGNTGGVKPPVAVSADGSAAAVSSFSRGVLGDGDPSWDQVNGGFSGQGLTTYVMDTTDGLADAFASDTPIALVGSCDPGTVIPSVDDSQAGPPGGPFISLVNFTAGGTVLTVGFGTFAAGIVPGHFVTGPGIDAGTRVESVDSPTQITIDKPTLAPGTFASVSIGQDATKVAIDGQSCPDPVEYAPGEFRDGSVVSRRGASLGGTDEGGNYASRKNVFSEDGSRLFFHSPDPRSQAAPPASCGGSGATTSCPTQLYVRQRNDGSTATRWVSRPEIVGQQLGLLGAAFYEGASSAGDRVFFSTNSPLTADDRNGQGGAPPAGGHKTGTANASSWDLYMYELGDGDDPADGGELTRVSAGPNGDGDCNVVQGSILGTGALRFASDDGTRLYFTCNAPLPGVAAASNGTITAQGGAANQPGSGGTSVGTTNLYMYENTGGAESWEFVAQLPRHTTSTAGTRLETCASSGSGFGQWRETSASGGGAGVYEAREGKPNCFRGTPDARFVTFETPGRLVESDPDAGSSDLYAFDADADELVRLSEPQGGVGGSYTCMTVGNEQCYGDGGFLSMSGNLPRQVASHLGVVTDPDSPGDRVAFFQSRSRLVAEDTDNTMDVYEWRNGELSLLTEGVQSGAFYSGNSADGRDVFFITEEQLSWSDIDPLRDLYDARVGGGDYDGFAPPPVAPPGCSVLAGACQGGGFDSVSSDTKTQSSSESDNAKAEARKTVAVSGLSSKARRKASRTGRLPLKVRASRAGVVRLTARAKLGKKARRVGRVAKRVKAGKAARVNLRLNAAARKRLRSGKRLRVTIAVRQPGARIRTRSILLPGVRS